jgi:Mg2+/citrate symporter
MKKLNIKINILVCICLLIATLSTIVPMLAQSSEPTAPTAQTASTMPTDPFNSSLVGILIAGLIWVLKTSILDNNKVIGSIPQMLEANRLLLEKTDARLVLLEKTTEDHKQALEQNTRATKEIHEDLKKIFAKMSAE